MYKDPFINQSDEAVASWFMSQGGLCEKLLIWESVTGWGGRVDPKNT